LRGEVVVDFQTCEAGERKWGGDGDFNHAGAPFVQRVVLRGDPGEKGQRGRVEDVTEVDC
jgi:hypothetical protein